MTFRLRGLIAATHTPFHGDGSLNLGAIAAQAERLQRDGVRTVFVGGSTGESASLTVDERLALAQRWSEVIPGSGLALVVHVGANSIADAKVLAAQAQLLGAAAISALAPSYFKPRSIDTLTACCAEIAGAAPELPFYFYDIPSMTGVTLSMPEFLATAAERIPNLAGLKFTNSDLVAYLKCLSVQGGRFDVAFGFDEMLLPALTLGAKGAVGSSYNFAAPLYLQLIAAYEAGNLDEARSLQLRSIEMIELLAGVGYLGAAKAVMTWRGVPVGPARLPNTNPTAEQLTRLRSGLERLGILASGAA